MGKWNRDSIIKFHEEYEGDYAGDTFSPEIIRLSRKYIRNKVLDIGAGSSALLKRILNPIRLDLVSRHPRIIRGDISNMPFKNSSFDTVFATELLEHLDDETLSKGLDEILRVLKRGDSYRYCAL